MLSNILEILGFLLAICCALFSYKRREGALFAFLLFDAWVFEWVVLTLLGEVSYSQSFLLRVFNIPVFVICGWAVMIYSFMHVFSQYKNTFGKAVLIATLMVTIDFFLDPIAVRLGLWTWVHPQGFFGIPYNNFFGWFSYSFLMVAGVQYLYAFKNTKSLLYIFLFVSFIGLGVGLVWYNIPLAVQKYLWWTGYSLAFIYSFKIVFGRSIYSR